MRARNGGHFAIRTPALVYPVLCYEVERNHKPQGAASSFNRAVAPTNTGGLIMIRKLIATLCFCAIPLTAGCYVDADDGGGDDNDCVTACTTDGEECTKACDNDGDCIKACDEAETDCASACI